MSSSIISELSITKNTPNIKWFYAVDIPNSRPSYYNYAKTREPQKFIPFSDYDSLNLEYTFQKSPNSKIPVHEDKLFEADLSCMEIYPVYWDGPRYEIRRGLWFKDGQMPLPTSESIEIDQGFEEVKPFLFNKNVPTEQITQAQLEDTKQDGKGDSKVDLRQLNDLYQLKDGRVVLYFNDKDAFLIPAAYLGKFQLDLVRTIGSNSYLGISRISRGYETKPAVDDNKDTKNDEIGKVEPTKVDTSRGNNTTRQEQDEEEEEQPKGDNMEHDFDLDTSQEEANREIDHLVFCVHGIGQKMGSRDDAYTFSHSVNLLRKAIKRVFNNNPAYQKLAVTDDSSNTRIQVLPISWRHKITFNPAKANKEGEDSRLPSLSQLNVDGIPYIREILGDVGCDILLYYEKEYLMQMLTAVTSELNRVYRLYKDRNPGFKGKVHILGHSLGSAISFDILSGHSGTIEEGDVSFEKELAFEVDKLFLVGSPVGIFKLIERKNIVGRSLRASTKQPSNEYVSPRCNNVYNLYHPCDPIAYRIEPLVNPKFGDFKAAHVPFENKAGLSGGLEMISKFKNVLSTKLWKTSKSMQRKTDDDSDLDGSAIFKKKELAGDELKLLTSLNLKGRLDYGLPTGLFDISLVSAFGAHIGYFEDENTVGFIIRELLTKRTEPVQSKVVSLY